MPAIRRSLRLNNRPPSGSSSTDTHPEIFQSYSKPLIPPEIISLIAYYAHLSRDLGTLATMMRTCRAGYTIAGPLLYRDLELDGRNTLEKISQGLSRAVDHTAIWTEAGHKRKKELFAHTEIITIHTPSCVGGPKKPDTIACWLTQRDDSGSILFPRLRQISLSGHYRVTRTAPHGADEVDICIHVLDADKYKDRPGLLWFLPLAIGAVTRSKQIRTIHIHNISWANTNIFPLLPLAQHVRIICPPPTIDPNRAKHHERRDYGDISLHEYREALDRDINYHMLDFDAFYRHLSVELVNFGMMPTRTTDNELEFAAVRREVIQDCALDFGLEEMGSERPPMVNEMGGRLMVRMLTVDMARRECTVCSESHTIEEGVSVSAPTSEPAVYENMTFYRYTRPSS